MQTILKRLEILKAAIALQDKEDIAFQTAKLEKFMDSDMPAEVINGVRAVIQGISSKQYSKALQTITQLLQRWNSLTIWQDPELAALRLEVQTLLAQITVLQDELTDAEYTIHSFELRHAQELGEVIMKLLALRRQSAAWKAEEQPHNTTAKQQFEEAQQEETGYSETIAEAKTKVLHELTEEEARELKTAFRKISHLTHPDMVDKQHEQQAAEIFIKAKEAQERNDLVAIRELLAYLQSGQPFVLRHETITATDELRREATRLRYLIDDLQRRLAILRDSETYKSVAGIEDWDTYFRNTRQKLEGEAERLSADLNAVKPAA